MKAFLMSMALLVIITAVAAVALDRVPMAAKDVYTEKGNVRL
ncbi:MAG: hypothetical protein R3D27_11500 [Hyphomicrobiaceae bacterium]